MRRQGNSAEANEPGSSSKKFLIDQTSALRGLIDQVNQSSRSLRLGVRLGSLARNPNTKMPRKKKTTE